MSINYDVPYTVVGFYPVTTALAHDIVNGYANKVEGGWDVIRNLNMGIYDRIVKWTDGHYYTFAVEGDKNDVQNGVNIVVYDMSDPNSVQSVGIQAQNIADAANAPLPDPFGPLAGLSETLKSVGLLILAGAIAYFVYANRK